MQSHAKAAALRAMLPWLAELCEKRRAGEALVEAVAASLGVGVVSKSELADDRRLVAVTIADSDSLMTESLVRLADRPPSAAIDAVFRVAEDFTSLPAQRGRRT